jgi:hypothetical protein
MVPLPPAPVSHAAALAAAAAATSQFYEYQNAAAAAAVTYQGQYPNGFETYPYTTAAGESFYFPPFIFLYPIFTFLSPILPTIKIGRKGQLSDL